MENALRIVLEAIEPLRFISPLKLWNQEAEAVHGRVRLLSDLERHNALMSHRETCPVQLWGATATAMAVDALGAAGYDLGFRARIFILYNEEDPANPHVMANAAGQAILDPDAVARFRVERSTAKTAPHTPTIREELDPSEFDW